MRDNVRGINLMCRSALMFQYKKVIDVYVKFIMYLNNEDAKI